MTKTQTIALYLIVVLLVADFAITHLRPFVALAFKEGEYFEASLICHEALSSRQQLQDAADRFDRDTLLALNRSATASLIDCYEKEHLRRVLLARGVSAHNLNQIDLKARNKSKASLPYFVRGLTGEK